MRERELQMLAWLLRRPDILRFQGRRIRKVPLSYPRAKFFAEALWDQIDRYEEAPSRDEFEIIVRDFCRIKELDSVQQAGALKDLEYLYTVPVTEVTGATVRMEIIRVMQAEWAERARNADPRDVENWVPELQLQLDEIMNMHRQDEQESLGIRPLGRDLDRCLEVLQTTYTRECISTGIPGLDERLLGGLRPAEVLLLQATTGAGKTALMLNIAKHVALNLNKLVPYYALDNDEADLVERTFASTTSIEIQGKIESIDAFKARIQQFVGGSNDNLLFRIWDPDDRTMADIAAHLAKVHAEYRAEQIKNGVKEEDAGKFGLIIIDYLDVVVPDSRGKNEDLRHQLKRIVNACKRLGRKYGCPVIIATQTNREGMKTDNPQIHHISEGIGKAHPANIIAILHQTEAQEALDPPRADLAIPKARRPQKKYIIPLCFDTARQRIWQDPEQPVRKMRGAAQEKKRPRQEPFPEPAGFTQARIPPGGNGTPFNPIAGG